MADLEFSRKLYEALCLGVSNAVDSPMFEGAYSSTIKALWYIHKAGGSMLPKDLARELKVTAPRVTVIIKELESRGLVERSLSLTDRRKVKVSLTKKGKARLKNHMEKAAKWLSGVIDKAGMEDSEAVLRFFNMMNNM